LKAAFNDNLTLSKGSFSWPFMELL